jgi:hypothetical protein
VLVWFSIWLESIALLPQLALISKTGEPTNFAVHYLVIIQSGYRVFSVLYYVSMLFPQLSLRYMCALVAGTVQVGIAIVALRRVLSAHSKTPSSVPAVPSIVVAHVVNLLRFGQLLSAAIGGYIFCLLIFFHNNHYCAFYTWACTPEEMEMLKVPWQHIVMLISVCPVLWSGGC